MILPFVITVIPGSYCKLYFTPLGAFYKGGVIATTMITTATVVVVIIIIIIITSTGADPEIFKRGGPGAIIYKVLERGGPKSLKMAFECPFQLFSYRSFANMPSKGGGPGPLGPSPKSATVAVTKGKTIAVKLG